MYNAFPSASSWRSFPYASRKILYSLAKLFIMRRLFSPIIAKWKSRYFSRHASRDAEYCWEIYFILHHHHFTIMLVPIFLGWRLAFFDIFVYLRLYIMFFTITHEKNNFMKFSSCRLQSKITAFSMNLPEHLKNYFNSNTSRQDCRFRLARRKLPRPLSRTPLLWLICLLSRRLRWCFILLASEE